MMGRASDPLSHWERARVRASASTQQRSVGNELAAGHTPISEHTP